MTAFGGNMRLLGLDVGRRRIGVAVSDELGWTAQPVTVVDHSEAEAAMEAIARLVEQYGVQGVVLGMPRRTDGSFGPEANFVREFGDALGQKINVPVHYQDERFSTVEAERALLSSGMRRTRRRKVVDQVAAGIILQTYLDRQRRQREREEWST